VLGVTVDEVTMGWFKVFWYSHVGIEEMRESSELN
jgi:hypothetical protein